ncbi:MAG: hypothetical protein K9J27_09870 [Bacteroidales bacterium]|nr:hypothetical protein [Bacteroidales bacterium]MCF8334161.1 hypothetical protein [Bacteroidales bacterium]
MKITIDIQDKDKAEALVYFLKKHGYEIQISNNDKLKDEDWILPGRPATKEEHEEQVQAMEKEARYEKGEDIETVFDRLFAKYSR